MCVFLRLSRSGFTDCVYFKLRGDEMVLELWSSQETDLQETGREDGNVAVWSIQTCKNKYPG